MKNYTYLLIVALFNYFVINVLAKNDYYVISIRRSVNDKEYDKSSEEYQSEIDELVNDRLNDIYKIIEDNRDTYEKENGKIDEHLDELETASHLIKRGEEKVKFKFINKNRPEKNKREFKRNEEGIEYVPFNSDLVILACPVKNYYVVVAYLSEEIVEKVRQLPNVISCKRRTVYTADYVIREEASASEKYYNEKDILNETKWKGLGVQEEKQNPRNLFVQLSALSQGVYSDSNNVYDNNYYYPSSAGKGIDIYVIDSGLNTLANEETKEDFDTYANTEDERIIKCVGEFYDAQFHPPHNEQQCAIGDVTNSLTHGNVVARSAVGKINGTAKKANLYMLSNDFGNPDILVALDYIKTHATPHKTVVNISIGCTGDKTCHDEDIQNKILELVEMNVIIFVAAGNETEDKCDTNVFSGAEGVISIGAVNNRDNTFDKVNKIYEIAPYSNYGECVVAFAPGTFRTPYVHDVFGSQGTSGTSYASPLVAGIAATLMSDDTETKYTYESMKQKIIDLSIKDAIKGVPENTPNRLINNGKRTIYVPPKCNDSSGKYSCGEKSCCTSFGFCADPNENADYSYCLTENGCQSEFGYCTTNACGENYGNRKCDKGQCCNREGTCINISEDINDTNSNKFCFKENGCVSEFSDACFTYDASEIDKYEDEEYKNYMLYGICQKEFNDMTNKCNFSSKIAKSDIDINEHESLCSDYDTTECDNFYMNPLKFMPTCEKINYQPQIVPIDEATTSEQVLYCAKNNSQNYCIESNEVFKTPDNMLQMNETQFCNIDSCRIPVYTFINHYIDLLNETNQIYLYLMNLDYYGKHMKVLQEKISHIISDECGGPITISDLPKKEPAGTVTSGIPSDDTPTKTASNTSKETNPSDDTPTKTASNTSKETNPSDNTPTKTSSNTSTETNPSEGTEESKDEEKPSFGTSRVTKISFSVISVVLISSLLLI